MTSTIIYIDRSDIRPGKGEELRRAVSDLVGFVEPREPRLADYGFYIDDAASTMAVVAVHPDSASLERHLAIGGPEFRKVGEYLSLRLIEIFGEPSDAALEQVHQKASMLGEARVVVHTLDAGFTRLPTAMP